VSTKPQFTKPKKIKAEACNITEISIPICLSLDCIHFFIHSFYFEQRNRPTQTENMQCAVNCIHSKGNIKRQ